MCLAHKSPCMPGGQLGVGTEQPSGLFAPRPEHGPFKNSHPGEQIPRESLFYLACKTSVTSKSAHISDSHKDSKFAPKQVEEMQVETMTTYGTLLWIFFLSPKPIKGWDSIPQVLLQCAQTCFAVLFHVDGLTLLVLSRQPCGCCSLASDTKSNALLFFLWPSLGTPQRHETVQRSSTRQGTG